MATVAARAVMRLATASSRSAAIRISTGVKPKAAASPFRISSRTPLTARIFRTPVELNGVSLVSMLPYHTATASALLNSMLSVPPHGHAWTLEGKKRTRYEGREKEIAKMMYDGWSKRSFIYLRKLGECLILESERAQHRKS